MKKYPSKPLIFVFLVLFSCSQEKKNKTVIVNNDINSKSFIESNIQDAARQYKVMKTHLSENQHPKSYHEKEKRFETSGSGWWCSGFYPGTLLYLYEETRDEELYNEAIRIMKDLEKEKHNTSTHDLGFMMYCSFGNANRIWPREEYKEILVTSAKSLASRYNPNVGCIKSWDSKDDDFLVIIDNMMNLELLFWATKETGDSTYYNIAVTHANTTLTNHFRNDNSSYHVLHYDPKNGEVKKKRTAQGAANESAWARGQAWGLYGYTTAYKETNDERYLLQASKIADFMLDHENMPEDKIPYWDYDAMDIPNALRDVSAAAILASGLLELSSFVNQEKSRKYFENAEKILMNLSNPTNKAIIGENGGFLLKHSVGHFPENSEVDVPLTYADYYYVEGIKRYKELL